MRVSVGFRTASGACRRGGAAALPLHCSALALVATLLLTAALVVACGSGDGAADQPGSESVITAGSSPGSSAGAGSIDGGGQATAASGDDARESVTGMYAQLDSGEEHLLLFDDGRYTYSNGSEFVHGRYTYDAAAGTLDLPLLGTFAVEAASGRLAPEADSPRHTFVPLPQQDPDVGQDAEGRPWNELDEEHAQRFADMDDVLAKIRAEIDADSAERSGGRTISIDELAGTWYQGDDTSIAVRINADGTWSSGRGLTYSHGLLEIAYFDIVFHTTIDSDDPAGGGACVMGDGAVYDPETDELIDFSDLRWHKGPPEPEYDPNDPF